jgi:hypothetical protein
MGEVSVSSSRAYKELNEIAGCTVKEPLAREEETDTSPAHEP